MQQRALSAYSRVAENLGLLGCDSASSVPDVSKEDSANAEPVLEFFMGLLTISVKAL